MSRTIDLVIEVERLVKEYGYNAILDTIAYLNKIQPVEGKISIFEPMSGNVWYLTATDYNRVLNELRAGNKIKAIKEFRDITSASLIDAKRAVETLN